jgi:hypothetical protein
MSKYQMMAEQIKAEFLTHYEMTIEQANAIIARRREVNSPNIPTVDELMTPKLYEDQRDIIALVCELDTAEPKRKAQIKYQLKHYYKFTLPK